MGLVSIGEFARLSRLSPKALRLYDELGLLPPARVQPGSGYRWYETQQLERASLVALLRRIGVPLGRIRQILDLEPSEAIDQIVAYWSGAEAEHAARRELVGILVGRLNGTGFAMYEVTVREVPARHLLSLIRHAHQEELIPMGREILITRMREANVPRVEGIVGAPFVIYHGEVSGDSDGPVEWCRPVPEERATEIAALFPDLTLRREPSHEEAFVHLPGPAQGVSGAQATAAIEALIAWSGREHREPAGGLRQLFVHNPANGAAGPDSEFAVPLR